MLEKPGSPSVNGAQTSHIRKRSIRGGFRDQTQQQLQRSYNNNSNNARQSLITPFLNQSSPSVAPANLPQTPAKTESAPSVLTLNSTRSSSPSASPSRSVDTSQILKGVVACLDIRTEDGDDVSATFERALQDMGAKTRRTFSDTITHLVFKNGSSATLKKALSRKINVVNLLWISRCKQEGRRLDEKDFCVEGAPGLLMAPNRRRKSMEPGKVRALDLEEEKESPARKRASSGRASLDPSMKRPKVDSAIISIDDTRSRLSLSRIGKPKSEILSTLMADTTAEPSDTHASNTQADANRCSPAKHDTLSKMKSEQRPSDHLSPAKKRLSERLPNDEIKAEIKAGFFVGSVDEPPKSSRQSKSQAQTPLRRKRRSTGNLIRPSINELSKSGSNITSNQGASSSAPLSPSKPPSTSISSLSAFSNSSTVSQNPNTPPPLRSYSSLPPHTKQAASSLPSHDRVIVQTNADSPTIVLINLDKQLQQRCIRIIERLGRYILSNRVDEKTACVIVDKKQRTEPALFALLYGVYFLKPEWLLDSESAGAYQDESMYEANDLYSLSKASRSTVKILPSTTRIWVSSNTRLAKESLERLIILANGTVSTSLNDADVVISNRAIDCDKDVIKEEWLFDCIENWRYLSMHRYRPTS